MKVGRGRAWLPVLLAVAGAVAALAPAAAAAPPEVSLEEHAVVVSGATPGGAVAVFGVSQGFNGFTEYYLLEDELLVDEDGDGAVRLELELPLSKRHSVWTVVDLASGELSLASSKGEAPIADPLPLDPLSAGGDEVTVAVQRWAYALWVRPGREAGAGAWVAIVGDGGASDGDGEENRQVRAAVSAFLPVPPAAPEGEGRPPERLASGDLVVVVDPETLAIRTTRLAGK